MIPILYEKTETAFASNGLGRLRDCISCTVTEERNEIYECDFEYPITGAHFDEIQIGRIIGVTHDDTGEVEPFDIVGYERPIDGVVTFHCTHISYRQSFYCVTASNISVIWPTAFDKFTNNSQPSGNPFTYTLDFPNGMTNTVISAFDGLPHTIRSILGGTEGSILDAIVGGCEYEWNKWNVILHESRGQKQDITIRYGVNMLEYNDELNIEEAYAACVPYWTDGTQKVIGDRQVGTLNTITNRGETVPLDVSEKFESKPTKAQVNAEGLRQINALKTAMPVQNITVKFVNLESELAMLKTCRLCDTIRVIFPNYNIAGDFKIVKVVWDALEDRYEEMELGALSTSLAEALGIRQGVTKKGGASVPVSQDSTTGVLSIG